MIFFHRILQATSVTKQSTQKVHGGRLDSGFINQFFLENAFNVDETWRRLQGRLLLGISGVVTPINGVSGVKLSS